MIRELIIINKWSDGLHGLLEDTIGHAVLALKCVTDIETDMLTLMKLLGTNPLSPRAFSARSQPSSLLDSKMVRISLSLNQRSPSSSPWKSLRACASNRIYTRTYTHWHTGWMEEATYCDDSNTLPCDSTHSPLPPLPKTEWNSLF